MKVITLLIIFTFAFNFTSIESAINDHLIYNQPTIPRIISARNGGPIFIELMDGYVYGGHLHEQEHYDFPDWIGSRIVGYIKIYVKGPHDNGFIVPHLTHLPNEHGIINQVRASIQIRPGDISYAYLQPLNINNHPPDHSRTTVYILAPEGITYAGIFE